MAFSYPQGCFCQGKLSWGTKSGRLWADRRNMLSAWLAFKGISGKSFFSKVMISIHCSWIWWHTLCLSELDWVCRAAKLWDHWSHQKLQSQAVLIMWEVTSPTKSDARQLASSHMAAGKLAKPESLGKPRYGNSDRSDSSLQSQTRVSPKYAQWKNQIWILTEVPHMLNRHWHLPKKKQTQPANKKLCHPWLCKHCNQQFFLAMSDAPMPCDSLSRALCHTGTSAVLWTAPELDAS